MAGAVLTTVGRVTTPPPLLTAPAHRDAIAGLDAALAVIVTLLCLYAAAEPTSPQDSGWREPSWVTALAGHRPRCADRDSAGVSPLTATALVLAAASLCLATGVIPDYASAAPIVAAGFVLYTVGTSLPRRRSLTMAVLAIVVFGEALVLAADSPFDPGAAQGAAFAALILGRAGRWAGRSGSAGLMRLSSAARPPSGR